MPPKVLAPVVILCSLLVCSAPVFAQNTIHVPADVPTIQGAINSSASGDTVLVSPGTYLENIDFKGKNITLISAQGASTTIIDGNNVAPVVSFHTSETNGATLNGFTLRHGTSTSNTGYSGGGVYISGASPKILNNVIDSNSACDHGGGIAVNSAGAPLIQGNTISNNSQSGCSGGVGGGGIGVLGSPGTQIINNVIKKNSWGSSGGGITLFAAGAVTIRGNEISNNTASNDGGGIWVVNEADEDLVQNLIIKNTASAGGGVYLAGGSTHGIGIVNNTIAENSAATGSAVYMMGTSQTRMVNNIFAGKAGQTAFYCDSFSASTIPTYVNNDVYSSGASAYGANCSGFLPTNGNSITADPQFISSSLLNFHVLPTSPVIDTGVNSDPDVPSADYDGAPRIVDGNNDSVATVDMGAFEYANTTAQALPDTLTFVDQLVLTSSAAQSITLTNTGSSALQVSSIAATSDFVLTNSCIGSTGIAVGASCTIGVTFQPLQRGQRDATLTILANMLAPVTASLIGKGIGPVPQFQPPSLSFASQTFGSTSAAQNSTLINNGDAPLNISTILPTGDFQQGNNCPAVLGIAASCNISVTFTPTQRGARTGAVSVTDNAVGSPHSLILSGTGVSASASLSPGTLSFGFLPFGSVSGSQQLTLTNGGDLPLILGTIAISPDYNQTNDCPGTLAVGAACHLNVKFSPLGRGSRPGTLSITDNAPGSPQTVSLSGGGLAPVMQLSIASLQFGSEVVGRNSTSVGVTLSNVGDTPMILSYLTHGDYNTSSTCPATLNVNASCSVSISFDPTTSGTRNGDVTFNYNGPSSPGVISLTGNGVLFGFDPSLLVFPSQALNESSKSLTINLLNISASAVNVSSITTSGDYQQTNACSASVAPNSSCSIAVKFTPTAAGSRIGTLTATTGAGTLTAVLTGIGFTPQIFISPSTNIAFGNQLIGLTSPSSRVTVINTGQGPLSFSSISVPPPFAQTNSCPAALGVNSACFIDVTVTPSATGALNGSLVITDDAAGSPQSIAVTATSVTSLTQATIGSLTPTAAAVGSNALTLTVGGSNFGTSSIVRWNGFDLTSHFVSSNQLQATVPATLLAAPGAVNITVFSGSPGGTTSGSVPFALYQNVAVQAKDLLYEPVSGNILASTPGNAASNANSLVLVDPRSLTVTNSIFIGNEPGKLALSATGHTAYVGQDGNGNVSKVDLLGGTVSLQFSLGSDSFFGTRYAQDMAVVPGTESAVVVARKYLGVSPEHAGLAVYDDGVKRTNETSQFTEMNTITFASRADQLYGYNDNDTGFQFRRVAVNASGVAIIDATSNLIFGFGNIIRSDGTHVFSSTGVVIDPSVPAQIAHFTLINPFPVDVLLMTDVNRVAFLSSSGPARIDIYDANSLANLGGLLLPSNATATRLVRWGTDGLAVRVTISGIDQIMLLHSSLLTASPSLPVDVTAASPSAFATGAPDTTVILTGAGFVTGMRARFNGQERLVHFTRASQIEVSVTGADLAMPGYASLDVLTSTGVPVAGVVVPVTGANSAFDSTGVDFGSQIFDITSPGIAVRLKNLASVPLTPQSISVTGDFAQINNCSSVPANGSCTINVLFRPRSMGAHTGTLTADLGHSPISIPLSGSIFDILLSIARDSRPSRSTLGSSSSTVKVAVALQAMPAAAVVYDCSGAPAGTVCTATPDLATGTVSVSLKSTGRLRKVSGSATVTLNARVGQFVRSLPVTLAPQQEIVRAARLR